MSKSDIDVLKEQSDSAEEAYQRAVRARKDAISKSAEALKAATKARAKYMRAVGQEDA
jgi:hypothetical protein